MNRASTTAAFDQLRARAGSRPFPPVGNRQNAEAEESEGIPVWRSRFVAGEDRVKEKDRQPEARGDRGP
jgi:hypothetical protein